MKRYKILGPPGTGKTSTLLKILENALHAIPPENIAFVSFTRRGTYEGVVRAKNILHLEGAQLRYFRTLHSLCFKELGCKKGELLSQKDYDALSKALGMRFTGTTSYEMMGTEGDRYISACEMLMNNEETYDKMISDLNINKLQFVAKNFSRYKELKGVMSFTDLLYRYLVHGKPLDVKLAIVDEAQDLTTLQWAVVEKMFSRAEELYIAGDDDQAIYEWAGADLDYFRGFSCDDATVLGESVRLTKAVYDYANSVLTNISNREEKEFRPRHEEGTLAVAKNWDQLTETIVDNTLILARNKYLLSDAAQALRLRGVPYIVNGTSVIDPKALRAIHLYEAWRKSIDDKEAEHLVKLYEEYFVAFDKSRPWYAVFSNPQMAAFYRSALANNVDLSKYPTVELSTIHAAKGTERENVILALDYSDKVQQHFIKDADAELRCLYVGATRAKQHLTLKLKEGLYGYPEFFKTTKGE